MAACKYFEMPFIALLCIVWPLGTVINLVIITYFIIGVQHTRKGLVSLFCGP